MNQSNGSCTVNIMDSDYAEMWHFSLTILGLGFLNVLIIGGNLLVVLAVATTPHLKSVNGLLITSLAVADLMVGLIVLPFSTSNEALKGRWIYGELWCQIWLAIDVWMCTASIYNLVAISLDRYLAILKPLQYPSLITIPRSRYIVASAWICSFLICFPPMATHWPAALSSDVRRCDCSPMGNSSGYILYSAIGSFFLPMAIIIFVYWRLYRTARTAVKTLYSGAVQVGNGTSGSMQMRVHSRRTSREHTTIAVPSPTPSLQVTTPRLKLQQSLKTVNEDPSTGLDKDYHVSYVVKKMSLTSDNGSICSITTNNADNFSSNGYTNSIGNRKTLYPNNNVYKQQQSADSLKKRQSSLPAMQSPTLSESESLLPNGDCVSWNPKKRPMINNKKTFLRTSTVDFLPNRTLEQAKANAVSRKMYNSSIATLWKKSARKLARRSTFSYHGRLSLEIRAAKTVAVVTGCFICCWLGFAVVYTMQATPYCQKNPNCIPQTVFSVVFWLGYMNSALNPVIYAVLNRGFRKAFKKLLTCSISQCRFT